MYRFKTEEEFISEFGVLWRTKIYCKWNTDMNHLLNAEVTEDFYHRTLYSTYSSLTIADVLNRVQGTYNWAISKDMLIQDSLMEF